MKNLKFSLLSLLMTLGLFAQTDVAYWEPVTITQGGSVDIFYNTINGTLPDDSPNVLIHLGWNDWTNVEDLPMTAQDDGWWMYHFDIPEEADILDFVFQDGAGNWDNNGGEGIDWHIAVDVPGLWEPLFPGPNDTIRISIQNPIPGNLWWGVNSWTAPLEIYQPENTEVGEAGLSVESALIGPDTNDVSYIEIGPFNSPLQPVTSVDFVFNFINGVWDNNNGNDYEFNLRYVATAQDPSVDMVNIDAIHVLEESQLVQVELENAEYSELLLDGVSQYTGDGISFDHTMTTTDLGVGRHELIAFARRDNQRVMMDIKTVWKIPELVEEAFPTTDDIGVFERTDGSITFSLLAPGKAFVSLVGDFNGWDPDSGLLKYDPAQDIFWTNMMLEPGSHEYMYKLNGEKLVGDPFATDVNWTDAAGNEHWSASNQKCVVHIGVDDFPWTDDEYVRPEMKDLIVYETLIRDLTATRDINGMIGKLDYLADLGINAIELMPPTEFPGENSWGYNPAFFMAVESAYGTPAEMKEFVNQAHQRGIAVIVDLVFNHTDGSSPYYQMYGDDYTYSPYIHDESNAWGFPDFDHARNGTRKLMSATVRHWINEYHIDGFRYDHTPGVGWSGATDFGISYFANEAYLANNQVYQIAEHFDSDIWDLINTTHINSHWHDVFHDQMKANLRQGQFEGSYYGDMEDTELGISYAAHGFPDAATCVNYIESHDEHRIIFEAQTNTAISHEQALQKARLAPQVLFSSTGIPMFYMGAEVGMDTERTLDYNPVQWDNLDSPENAAIFYQYEKMIWLRNNYPALRSNNINVVLKSDWQKSIVFHRVLDGSAVVVAINFGTSDQTLDLEFPWAGTWYEYTEDDTMDIESNWFGSYTLPASSARIFTNERHWVGTEEKPSQPLSYSLYPAFPNPFNPSTTLRFDLPVASQVRLKIFDIRGREVWSHNSNQQAGSHQVVWSGVNLMNEPVAAGLYFAELSTPEYRKVNKLMLVK